MCQVGFYVPIKLSGGGYSGDVGVHALIPVQETFQVDLVTNLQILDSLINGGILAAQIALNGEVVGLTVDGDVEVQVVAVLTGAIPLVEVGNIVAVCVLGSLNGHTLEGYEHILALDQILGAEQCGNVLSLCNIGTLKDLPGCVNDLNLTGPSGLGAGNLYLGTDRQLSVLFLGAGQLIQEVCAVAVLGIEGTLVVSPALLSLNVSLDGNLALQRSSLVLSVRHNAFGLCVDVYGLVLLAASKAAQSHNSGENNQQNLLHFLLLLY